MKLSRYNFLRQFDGTTIFFNAGTCALAIVDENFLRVVDDVKNNRYDEKNYDAQLIADMKASGCLVEDDVDELARLEFFRTLSKYDATSFGLTIAPTLDCNFRCKYCFETHPKGFMSADTAVNRSSPRILSTASPKNFSKSARRKMLTTTPS